MFPSLAICPHVLSRAMDFNPLRIQHTVGCMEIYSPCMFITQTAGRASQQGILAGRQSPLISIRYVITHLDPTSKAGYQSLWSSIQYVDNNPSISISYVYSTLSVTIRIYPRYNTSPAGHASYENVFTFIARQQQSMYHHRN